MTSRLAEVYSRRVVFCFTCICGLASVSQIIHWVIGNKGGSQWLWFSPRARLHHRVWPSFYPTPTAKIHKRLKKVVVVTYLDFVLVVYMSAKPFQIWDAFLSYVSKLKAKMHVFIFLCQDNISMGANKADSGWPRPEVCNLISIFFYPFNGAAEDRNLKYSHFWEKQNHPSSRPSFICNRVKQNLNRTRVDLMQCWHFKVPNRGSIKPYVQVLDKGFICSAKTCVTNLLHTQGCKHC